MHFLDSIRRWVGALAELGISIIALGVVLQVLFGDGTGAVPFLPVDVLGSVIGFVDALGSPVVCASNTSKIIKNIGNSKSYS